MASITTPPTSIDRITPPTSPLSRTRPRKSESPPSLLTQSCHLFDHLNTEYVVDPVVKKLRRQTYFAAISNAFLKHLTPKPFDVFSNYENSERFIDRSMRDQAIGVSKAQGKRPTMQDAHIAYRFKTHGKEALFAGVFDGHGPKGEESAIYLRDHIPSYLETKLQEVEALNETTIPEILTEMMVTMDQTLQAEITEGKSGTTASCCFVINDQIFVPNVGDSRAVFVKKKHFDQEDNKGFQVTEDASTTSRRFFKAVEHMEVPVGRLEGEGAYGPPRLNYELGLARELGHKSASARPKIAFLEKGINDNIDDNKHRAKIGFKTGDYLVIACDGLYDVASTNEIIKAVRKMDKQEYTPEKMSSHLVSAALNAGTTDNVTVMVIRLS